MMENGHISRITLQWKINDERNTKIALVVHARPCAVSLTLELTDAGHNEQTVIFHRAM